MATKANKLIAVVSSLGLGGAERVATLLLQNFDRKEFEPLLVTFRNVDKCVYELPSDLHVISLGIRGRVLFQLPKIILRLVWVIRLEKPKVVLSFLTHCNLITIMAARLSGVDTAVIASEHSVLTPQLKVEPIIYQLIKKFSVKILYPLADAIVAVSKGVRKDLIKNFSMSAEKVKVIYNPIDVEGTSHLSRDTVDHPWFKDELPIITAMGRLQTEKGYHYLLRAFARVKRTRPCRLVIIGEGEERNRLEHLARTLGIERDVVFFGFQKNPFKYITRSNVFVLPSLWEGFGNVIVEAMACGTPIVASDCPSGPSEIIEDGFNGLLVPPADVEELARATLLILNDRKLAKRIVEGGRCRAKDFCLSKQTKEYERLLKQKARFYI